MPMADRSDVVPHRLAAALLASGMTAAHAASDSIRPIPVVVAGALGRMGSEVVKAVNAAPDCMLVAAIDNTPGKQGADVGLELGLDAMEVEITDDFEGTLCQASQAVRDAGPGQGAVLVDFTHPNVVYGHCRGAIAYGVHPVIGTTGLGPEQLADLAGFAAKASIGGAVIPNFSVGMVLLQQAAAAAARFYDYAELTELHHNRKADAPSGTCIKTAELMEELGKSFNPEQVEEHESLPGCRGGRRESGLRLHSVRLPGLVAHQEVMFGAPGETYTLRHDTIDRSAYMPGVLLTVRRVRALQGLVYGLERLL
jgi:4-hydroxy-tetrahydrodipicolinate reductase